MNQVVQFMNMVEKKKYPFYLYFRIELTWSLEILYEDFFFFVFQSQN